MERFYFVNLSHKMDRIAYNLSNTMVSMQSSLMSIRHEIDSLKKQQLDSNQSGKINHKKTELHKWFKYEVCLEEYYDLFIKNGFEELNTLISINMNDLVSLGINKLGHRIKIMQSIAKLKSSQTFDK